MAADMSIFALIIQFQGDAFCGRLAGLDNLDEIVPSNDGGIIMDQQASMPRFSNFLDYPQPLPVVAFAEIYDLMELIFIDRFFPAVGRRMLRGLL